MIDRTYLSDPYEGMSDDPCDYCQCKDKDKCDECRKKGLHFRYIESGAEDE